MSRLKEVLQDFQNKSILVVGDIFLDEFCWGEVDRVNPEQPAAPLVKISKKSHVLGGAANVANNVVSLGAKARLYGITGRDDAGEKIRELCRNAGINLKTFNNGQPTIVKQRVYAHGQQINRCDYGETELKGLDEKLEKDFTEILEIEVGKPDAIILSDYNKYVFGNNLARRIIKLANSRGIPVLADPKPRNIDSFNGCTIIRPNKRDAEAITGMEYQNREKRLKEMAKKLAETVDSNYSIITCGEDGVFSYDRKKDEYVFVGTKARQVSDVTGAGDTFMASLSLGIASGLNLHDAVTLANYASGVVVEKVGTATATIEEIKEQMRLESFK